jgi:hypothetical protein
LGEQAKCPIDKKLGEQAKCPIDKKLGEQAKCPIDKKLGEQAKCPIDKKSAQGSRRDNAEPGWRSMPPFANGAGLKALSLLCSC